MLFTQGALAGALSGSLGNTTASRNRYGTYFRTRAVPVNPNTAEQQSARATLSNLSTAWGALTADQRLSWGAWAAQNPVVNALGQSQILAGNVAFIQINARILRVPLAQINAPPIGSAPNALLTLSLTGDIGSGTFGIAFTTTPLAATERIWASAAVSNSAGINYVENLYKQTTISTAAQASPLDNQTDIEARFGTLVVGQVVHQRVSVFDHATGLLSAPRRARVTIIDTP